MNKQEASAILSAHMARYRHRDYEDLQRLLNEQDTFEVTADSGIRYQLEFHAVWDDRENKNLRVLGSIDDGGTRAIFPLSDDFIMAPDESFVGE